MKVKKILTRWERIGYTLKSQLKAFKKGENLSNNSSKQRPETNPFKFVSNALDFAEQLAVENNDDYPSICFSLCYAATRLAFIEKKNDLKLPIHLILNAYAKACEDLIFEDLEKQDCGVAEGRVLKKNQMH